MIVTKRNLLSSWVNTVQLGDCLELMDEFPDNQDYVIITDPPYGIGWKGHSGSAIKWKPIANDIGMLDLSIMLNKSCTIVSFGANCYPNQLPHRGRWICWDKRVNPKCDKMLGSPFELAWTNKTSGFDKIYRIMHGGVVNADGGNAQRFHPTQKPVMLMKAIILDYSKHNDIILDPFCGSGSTLIAAKELGRRYIGIELEPKYVQISKERLANTGISSKQDRLDAGLALTFEDMNE